MGNITWMSKDIETGMYYDRASAETTVQGLRELGYADSDISVMMKDKDEARKFATDTGSNAAEGAVTGGVIGGGIGALIAGLTATGSIAAIVGTGGLAAPVVVGPLAAALAGLGAGALSGGIIGALIGAGIPKEKATEYEEGLNRGGILLGVHPREGDRDRVRAVFATSGGTRRMERGSVNSNDLISARS